MDMTQLGGRKFLMGSGATIWAIFQNETNANKIWAVVAIVLGYMIVEGVKDWLSVKKPAEGAAS